MPGGLSGHWMEMLFLLGPAAGGHWRREAGEEAPWAAGAGEKALPAICKTLAGAMGNFCLTSAGVINRCPEA